MNKSELVSEEKKGRYWEDLLDYAIDVSENVLKQMEAMDFGIAKLNIKDCVLKTLKQLKKELEDEFKRLSEESG